MQAKPSRAFRAAKITPVKKPGRKRQWRVQVWDPVAQAFVSACAVLRMPGTLFDTKTEAKAIAEQAESVLAKRRDGNVTVAVLQQRWLNRPLDKESSRITSVDRTRAFVERYADLPIALVTGQMAFEYDEACPASHIAGLKSMFNWGVKRKLLLTSPFAEVERRGSAGNAKKKPPSVQTVERMIEAGWTELPSFGAWLAFGAWVGTRPGETDALRWSDFEDSDLTRVTIARQWSHKTRTITLPKNGQVREGIVVPEQARAYLRRLPRTLASNPQGYVFLNTRGRHFTQTSRAPYWKAVKAAAPELRNVPQLGINPRTGKARDYDTYMATRHFCGWFLYNEISDPPMEAEDIAFQLGHEDNGDLVRRLYGHRERGRGLDRIARAHERRGTSAHGEAHGTLRRVA